MYLCIFQAGCSGCGHSFTFVKYCQILRNMYTAIRLENQGFDEVRAAIACMGLGEKGIFQGFARCLAP